VVSDAVDVTTVSFAVLKVEELPVLRQASVVMVVLIGEDTVVVGLAPMAVGRTAL
jgi:hypothetical protein